ncbi:YkgJ family cysteine cluster protein [Myxococcaceae bacterium JPH2]|nr:YkgJ family cysteine cluster protein [Myxococcaceae bacterium JPH2]
MPLSTLCLRCGLCCDGTLFTTVAVRPSEVEPLRQRGVPLVERADGSPALAQHCAALEGRHCTVYAERPESCRRYRCHLLTALAEGEVSLDEALGVVDQAHALVDAVAHALPPPQAGEPRAVMQRARQAGRAAGTAALSAEAQEARDRADAFLVRRFQGRFGHGG